KNVRNGYEYTIEKMKSGLEYAIERMKTGWKWICARSLDDILFGVRTTGSLLATIFAILTGIGLAVGWNAPGLGFVFVISVGIFAAGELTCQIRTIIQKRTQAQDELQDELQDLLEEDD
ncbi:MAG: hypothetical protein ACTSYI_11005, partial [Promethearchaeota archaeon]